jgi:hypothetical protein
MSIRLAREEDAKEISTICLQNHISWERDIGKLGGTIITLPLQTLQTILANNKSIVSTQESKVTGYALTLDNQTHKHIFETTIQERFQQYAVPIKANAIYFLQACLDPSVQPRPSYMQMLTRIEQLGRESGHTTLYGEILKVNKRSRRVHEKLRKYKPIATRTYTASEFLYCETSKNQLPIENIDPTGEVILYEKKLY